MNKWALVSVFDKQGIVEFCKQLVQLGYGILSTGGTARHLEVAGVQVTAVEEYTGFPEMMDGRVKTLHPKIHGGLLGLRDNLEHLAKMREHGIDQIDLVVVNLYPFAKTIAEPDATFAECVEMIDIGGPSMLRAAAKNHRFCAPIIDPADYTWVANALVQGELTETDRVHLAAKVFRHTGEYDALIATYLEQTLPTKDPQMSPAHQVADVGHDSGLNLTTNAWPYMMTYLGHSKQPLRYGENPHQGAHFYADPNPSSATIAGAEQIQGKELSYNNIQDADAALNILRAFDDMQQPVVVAVKHMNPCGVGMGNTIQEAFARAYEADPISIFGGIVACNREVDGALAEQLTGLFLEIVMAPEFTEEALQQFAKKKNVRLLKVAMNHPLWLPGDKVFRRVSGGLLVQDVNLGGASEWRVVTERQPTEEEEIALKFAWRVVQFVKSNAIVLTNHYMTLGIGAGQMNRVGAAKIAIEQAATRAVGSVLGSDAFFPMRDTVDTAAAAGIKAMIQPGGSIKDQDSIAAANEHGIAMVFTGTRHFLH